MARNSDFHRQFLQPVFVFTAADNQKSGAGMSGKEARKFRNDSIQTTKFVNCPHEQKDWILGSDPPLLKQLDIPWTWAEHPGIHAGREYANSRFRNTIRKNVLLEMQRHGENRVHFAVDMPFQNSRGSRKTSPWHQLMENINGSKNDRNVEFSRRQQSLNTHSGQAVQNNGIDWMIAKKSICFQTSGSCARNSRQDRQPDHSRTPDGHRRFRISAMNILADSGSQTIVFACTSI